jgi:hypothetical protein
LSPGVGGGEATGARPTGAELTVGLSAVIVAVTEEVPRILTVARSEWGRARHPALPFGPLDPLGDRTLELGLRGWVREQTGLELGYVEQLYTFGDRDRADRPVPDGGARRRVLSVAYLALVRESEDDARGGAVWLDAYRFLPWEDWRGGRPGALAQDIEPALRRWAEAGTTPAARQGRTERMEIAFGLGRSRWDAERVLDRYELLYEARLVAEADPEGEWEDGGFASHAMAVDHRRILATALGRLRGKLKYPR